MKTHRCFRFFILCSFLLAGYQSYNQKPVIPLSSVTDLTQTLEEQMEELSDRNDTESDYADIADDWARFLAHPVNINQATENELSQLRLNDAQIQNLKSYILQFGEMAGPYELNLIPGFDSLLVTQLLPYVSFHLQPVACETALKNMINSGKHQLILRFQQTLETQKGYLPLPDSVSDSGTDNRYLGGPEKLYLRYGYNFCNKIRLGITMEKDPGEPFLRGSDTLKKGFDFYSAFIFYTGRKFLKQMAIGDYHVQFGQGLTMQSSLGFGKSSNAIASRKIMQPIKPSTSADESRYMRGMAASFSILKNAELTLFYSSVNADARLTPADTLSETSDPVASFPETGFHRTPSELAGKDAVNKRVFGGNLQARLRMFRLGITALRTEFENPVMKQDNLYRRFEFSGKQIDNFGIDYAVIIRKMTMYGEFSGSSNGGKAMLSGLTLSPAPSLAASVVYRNYSPDYRNFFSNAFAEGSGNVNEHGVYFAIQSQLARRINLIVMTDHFRFPWLKYRVDAPSSGCEYALLLVNRLSGKAEIQLRYRFRKVQVNTAGQSGFTDFPEDEYTQSIRAHATLRPMEFLTLRSRIETIWWEKEGSEKNTGFLAYQDIILNHPEKPWQLSTRFAIFDTDTYQQRIYAYESDVLYAFSVPACFNKGSRFYLMVKYTFGKSVDLWVRYALTYYAGQQVTGSGLDEIEGNKKSEIKIQARIRF